MKSNKAIILVSGGLDSCVTAALAIREYQPYFLHTNYEQLTHKREKKAFFDIANFYNIRNKMIVNIDYLNKIGGSSLTDGSIEVPMTDSINIPNTYVPFRNANLIAIAVSWAEVTGAQSVFIGAMEEDSSGYPDCREKFFKSFNQTIKEGTKPETQIKIKVPLLHKNKSEVVKLGMKLNAPLELTWSCYKISEIACGVCDSCRLRIEAFKNAGFKDPIPYKIDIDW